MNLQEFNYLVEDPSSVSWPVKLLALAILLGLILFIGYKLYVVQSLETLSEIESKETELKQSFEMKQRRASQLKDYVKQLDEMKHSFSDLVKQLPSGTEIPALIMDISEKGVVNGLEIESFEPGKEEEKEFYAEKPIKIKAVGTYQELAMFVSDISGLPRIVTIHDIQLLPTEAEDERIKKVKFLPPGVGLPESRLQMEAVIKTYRYLDEKPETDQPEAVNS